MENPSLRSRLLSLLETLPEDVSYEEVMYRLYVCMKIDRGKKAVQEGNVIPHEKIMQKYRIV